jgi:RHS repeat-associated protein
LIDRINLPDGSYYEFFYEATSSGSGNTTGRITQVHLPTGGTITYTYTGGDTGRGISCDDGSTTGFNRTTPDGTWTYRRAVNSYNQYTFAALSTTTTITDPQGNATVVDAYTGFVTQHRVYQGAASGTLLEQVITCYNGTDPINYSACPGLAVAQPFTRVSVFRSLNGGPYSRVDSFYSQYGLVTKRDEYDWGASSYTRETQIAYDTTLGNGIVDHPSTVKIYDGSGGLRSETDYSYDDFAISGDTMTCSPYTKCRGNLTKLTRYANSSTTLTTQMTYNLNGTMGTSLDPNGVAKTTFTYGTGGCGAFPSQTQIVAGSITLTTSDTYNCTGAVIASTADENGNTSYTNYTADPYFWRPESTQDELGNFTYFSYPSSIRTERNLPIGGASAVDTITTRDSLGRPSLTQVRQAPWSPNFDSTLQWYDNTGKLAHMTMPYVGTLGQNCCGAPATTTNYDPMGRPLQLLDANNTTVQTLSYQQNDIYIDTLAPSGEHDKRKQLQYDGLGRLTSVCEITGGTTNWPSGNCGQISPQTGYWTTYQYDSLGRLTSVTQNAQSGTTQSRSYTYDQLGRLTSETNPESGTTTYAYDTSSTMCGNGPYTSKGDLLTKTDANGNCVMMYYDGLHRVTDVGNNNQAVNHCKRFRYDNSGGYPGSTKPAGLVNTLGRLIEAATDHCDATGDSIITDEWLSYSARGEITDVYESTLHSGGYYHTTASYWANGALASLGGLSGVPTFTTTLEGEGRVSGVNASFGPSPVVSSSTYTVSGKPAYVYLGNGSGDYDRFLYDSHTDRMTQYAGWISNQWIYGNLAWNPNGTLSSLTTFDPFNSAVNNQTCNYVYDDLARLTSASCGSSWSQTFSYDPFSNITKVGSISWMPGYNSATNRYTLGGTSYDNDGNLMADTFHSYGWNVDSLPTAIDATQLTYNALGQVVEMNNTGTITDIVYTPSGRRLAYYVNGSLAGFTIDLPGGLRAGGQTSGAGVQAYSHPDWLGSSRTVSSVGRTWVGSQAYAPSGETYAAAGSVVSLFTNQYNDEAGDLYDFAAREQHRIQGRWISPDPAGLAAADPSNPQSWNRYAYVGNSPLNATDPLGLFNDAIGSGYGSGICIEGPACGWGQFGSSTFYVNGIMVPASVGAALEIAGVAVNCPQCRPGDRIGVDNSYWQLEFGLVGSWSFNIGTIPGNEDSTLKKIDLFAYALQYAGQLTDYFTSSINKLAQTWTNCVSQHCFGPPPPAPTRGTIIGRCTVDAINANNGAGLYNHTGATSSPDVIAPSYAPGLSLYSQRIGKEPFNAKFEGEVSLSEPRGDIMLFPPGFYVSVSTRNCMADHGLTPH